METTNNELEKAQFGTASAAGYGAPFEYLPGLKNYINLAREIASQYGVITIKNREAKAFVALFFMRQLKGATKLLPSYIADLKQGKCIEACRSDLGSVIAGEWQIAAKRPQLKAAVVGGLKKAGVIQGSDLSIASAIVGADNADSKTFAVYMGRGKKGDIADWICNHVKD